MTSTYSGVMTYQMLHDVVAARDLAVQQQRRSSYTSCVGVCSSSTKGLVPAPRLQQGGGAAVGFSARQRTNRYPREAVGCPGQWRWFPILFSRQLQPAWHHYRALITQINSWVTAGPAQHWTRIPGCRRGSAQQAHKMSPCSV
jgi:hypothetical protein